MKYISKIFSLFEYHILWPIAFTAFKIIYKADQNTVLFADPYSHELTDNMKPVYTALKNKGGFRLLTSFPEVSKNKNKITNRIERSKSELTFLKLYAQSKVLILTESYLPAYAVKPRTGTKVIQLWHGCGAFKKWGYSTLSKSFGATKKDINAFPMHNCYTLVPVSSSEVTSAYAEAFNCEKSIISPLGIPRTDVFFNNTFISDAKNQILKLYPNFKDKKIILYAPTFRGKNITSAKNGFNLDFTHFANSVLQNENTTNQSTVLLCKLHPFAKSQLQIPDKVSNLIFDVSNLDINLLLCVADILITDYSSLIFEYSLLNRPMLFYAYDLENYMSERDFYYPYNDFVPGRIIYKQEELENALLDILNNASAFDSKSIKEFKEKYMCACDGNSTKRIIDYILHS